MLLANVLNRLLVVAAILALTVPRTVYSLSIYDVIMLSQKGYETDNIITLIETTGSAFDLTAKDVTRLKEAGVSETVIQAMLAVVLLEPQENTNIPPEPTANQRSQETNTPITSSGGIFTSMPINEEDAGGHQHQAITFGNIKLLILRDEGAYSSVAARAASVVRHLQQAQSIGGNGKFKANHAGGGVHAVVFQTQDRREIVIISASWRDAWAYKIRSGRHVNPDILADYWSDLLSDYWSIIFLTTAPTRLNNLHEGEALQALFRQLTDVKNGDADQLTEAVRSLPSEVHEHLELLAATVPREFGRESNHKIGEQ